MKLWLLKRPYGAQPVYDATDGVVVRAESEAGARNIASNYHGDEGVGVWLTDEVTCEELTADGEPGMILQDFNAG